MAAAVDQADSRAVDAALTELIRTAVDKSGGSPLVEGAVADAIRAMTIAKSQFANIGAQAVANEFYLRGQGIGKTLGLNPEQLKGLFPYPGGNNTTIGVNQPSAVAPPQVIVLPATPPPAPPPSTEKRGWGQTLWPLLAALGLGLGGLGLGAYLSDDNTPAPVQERDPWGGGVGLEIEG